MKKNIIFTQILAMIIFTLVISGLGFLAFNKRDLITMVVFGFISILYLLMWGNTIRVINEQKGKKDLNHINYTKYIIYVCILLFVTISSILLYKNISFRITGNNTISVVYDKIITIKNKTNYGEDNYNNTEKKCDIFIKYKVNNVEYKSKLDVSSCKYNINDKIKIYYNKNDPTDFVSGSIGILLLCESISVGALILFIFGNLKNKKKK